MKTPTVQQSRTSEVVATLFILLAAFAGLIVVLLRRELLPENFFYDGEIIQRIAQGSATGDPSYNNTANVYARLGLGGNETLASLAGYALAVVALVITWARCRQYAFGWKATILAMLAAFFFGVYLGYYSKDVLVVPIVIAILVLPRGRVSWLVIVGLILLYAAQFRTYWYIVGALYVGYWLVIRRFDWKTLIFTGLIVTVLGSLAISVVLGVDPSHFRTLVNDARVAREVGTAIQPFVSLPEPVGGVVNNALTYLTLMIPLPLLATPTLYYIGIAGVISFIWVTYHYGVRTLSVTEADDPIYSRCVALISAYVSTQALFEPDYGSALRHLTPLLPLFLYVVWRAGAVARARRSERAALTLPQAAPRAALKG